MKIVKTPLAETIIGLSAGPMHLVFENIEGEDPSLFYAIVEDDVAEHLRQCGGMFEILLDAPDYEDEDLKTAESGDVGSDGQSKQEHPEKNLDKQTGEGSSSDKENSPDAKPDDNATNGEGKRKRKPKGDPEESKDHSVSAPDTTVAVPDGENKSESPKV